MIINVGGRTDIVNYYTPWLINRLREGFVYTRNPFNPKQVTRYDLNREKVDALIFCSKNYKAILKHMPDIAKKYPIYCHYTITCYGKDVEKNVPSIDESIEILTRLSEVIGKDKLSWRYDPILLTDSYTIEKHVDSFEYMTSKLHDKVNTCIFSFVDMYNKVYKNMPEIIELTDDDKHQLLLALSKIAKKYEMPLQSCAVGDKYKEYGIINSGCITREMLESSNNIEFKNIRPGNKRKGCSCMPWRDIGEYDTCLNECKYCYANKRPKIAMKKYKQHDSNSPILIGNINDDDIINNAKQKSFLKIDDKQQRLMM